MRDNSIKISEECYRLINAPTEEKKRAAEGSDTNLSKINTIIALFFLAHDKDIQVRKTAAETIHKLETTSILESVKNGLDPRILCFILKHIEVTELMLEGFFSGGCLPEESVRQVVPFITPELASNISSAKQLRDKLINAINLFGKQQDGVLNILKGSKYQKKILQKPPFQVKGSLNLFGILEFIQVLELNRRDGVILIKGNGQKGALYISSGHLIHAVFENKVGRDAFKSILCLDRPFFTYYHNDNAKVQKTINETAQSLIMNVITNIPVLSDTTSKMFIQGSLDVLDMVELSQLFELNMKPVAIKIVSPERRGVIFCREGSVKHAICGKKEGVEAAYDMFTWNRGLFSISGNVKIPKESVSGSMQGIILEAMRLLDESSRDEISPEEDNDILESKVVKMPVSERISQVFKRENALDVLISDKNTLVRKAIDIKVNKTVEKIIGPDSSLEEKKTAAEGRLSTSLVEKAVILFYLSHNKNGDIRSVARKTLSELNPNTIVDILKTEIHPMIINFLASFFSENQEVHQAVIENECTEENTLLLLMPKLKKKSVSYIVDNIGKFPNPLPVVGGLLEHCKNLDEKSRELLNAVYDREIEKEGRTQVGGDISLIALPDIIQCIEQGMKTAVFALEKDSSNKGIIYFDKGSMIQAYTEDKDGEDAFYEMFSWSNARFRMTISRNSDEARKIMRTSQNILMDAIMKAPTLPDELSGDNLEIRGDMSVIDIGELALLYESNRKNCSIYIKPGKGDLSGALFFADGRLVDAELKEGKHLHQRKREAAALTILSWHDGTYQIRPCTRDCSPIPTTVSNILLESMRLLDEGELNELPGWELSEDEFQSLFNKVQGMSISEKVKFALKGDKNYRRILITCQNKLVCTAVIKNPRISEDEVAAATQSRNIHQDVLRLISMNPLWIKKHSTKLNLANNPKTPLEISMRYLSFFRFSELVLISKNKNVPATLATAARRVADVKAK